MTQLQNFPPSENNYVYSINAPISVLYTALNSPSLEFTLSPITLYKPL